MIFLWPLPLLVTLWFPWPCLSKKMLLLSRPQYYSFLPVSQIPSSFQFFTTWLLCPLIHLLKCFVVIGQQNIRPRALLSFPFSSHASKGNTSSVFSINETWGGAWEGFSISPYPLFRISSHLGSEILKYYVCAYLWAIVTLYCMNIDTQVKSIGLSQLIVKWRIIP